MPTASPPNRWQRWTVSVRFWTGATIAMFIALVLVLTGLHFSQARTLSQSRQLLTSFRDARIDLSKGFLHLMVSGNPQSPLREEVGLALLDQASIGLERDGALFAGSGAKVTNPELLATFKTGLNRFREQLSAYRGSELAARESLELPLYLSFHSLEELTQRMDDACRSNMEALTDSQNQRFAVCLAVAILLMGLTCVGVYEAGRRQSVAVRALRTSEGKLSETNRFLTDLIEHSAALIFVKDSEGRYELVNRRWEEVTGVTRERVLAKTDRELFPGEMGDRFSENDRKVLQTGQPLLVEESVVDATGERIFLSTKFPVRTTEGDIRGICGMAHDVTARKQGEVALKRQSELLASINVILSMGLGRDSEEAMCRACLQVVEQTTKSQISFIGEIGTDGLLHDLAVSNPTWDVCHMQDQAGHRKPPGFFRLHGILGRVLNEGRSLIVNDPANHPDRVGFPEGHPPLFSFLGVPLKRDGKTIGMVGVGNRPGGYTRAEQEDLESLATVILEALDRERAEATLREREAQLESFLNTAATGLVRNSRDLRYQSANTAYARLVNRRLDQIIGHSLAEVLGERAFANIKPHIDRVLAGERVEYESVLPLPDNSQCWIHAVYAPDRAPSGEIVGWVASITDITTRRQAEQGRAQLAAIVESSEDAIVGKDLNGIVTSWNRGAEKLFGYRATEMIGQPLRRIFPPDRAAEELQLLARITRGEVVEHWETERVTKDGRRKEVSVTISPICDMDGRIVGASKIARDITERKRVEKALRLSEEQLNFALQASHTGAWSVNLRDRTATRTLIQARIFGYASTASDWSLDKFLGHVLPEDLDRVLGRIQEGIAQKEDWEIECRIRRTDGEVRWIHIAGGVERGVADPPARMFGIVQDITERKQTEQSLHESETRRRLALDAAQAGTWEWEPATGRNFWSDELWKLYGLPPNSREPSYAAWRETVHPESREQVERQLGELVQRGREVSLEWRVNNSDGNDRWLMSRGRPLRNAAGQVVRYLGVVMEITERKQAELALRQSEEKFRRVVQSNILAVAFWRADGQITEANQAFCDLIGRAPADISAGRVQWTAVTPPELLERDRQAIEETNATGVCRPYEKAFLRPDGHRVPVLIGGAMLGGLRDQGVLFAIDITELKELEERLRVSERRHTLLFEKSTTPTVLVKLPEVVIADSNEACAELTGFTREEMCGKTAAELGLTSTRAREETISRFNRDGVLAGIESRLLTKSGAERIVVSKTNPLLIDGKSYAITTLQDITARKVAEEALQKSERRFRQVTESLPQLVWTCAADGPCDYLSPQWVHYTGKSEAEQLGYGWLEQIDPEDRNRTLATWQATAAHGKNFEMEYRIRRYDGNYRWFRALAVPLHDESGAVVKWFGSNTDIEDLKQAEAALRESETNLRQFLNTAEVGLLRCSRDLRYTLVNSAQARLLGRPVDEIVGRTIPEIAGESVLASVRPSINQVLDGHVVEFELELNYAGTGPHWVHSIYSPDYDTEGRVTGWVASVTDITERKKAEERVHELNRTLEQRVQERTAELRASNEELDAFVYAVSHDLRAPLRAMNGFSQVLREDFAPQLPPTAGEYLDLIQQGSREMGHLIDGLLRLSRITRAELEVHPVDISALAARLLAQLRNSEPGRQVACTIVPRLKVNGDAGLLEIALTNLLSNAWKYSSGNPQAAIRVGGEVAEDHVTISVSDNGAGFDMNHATRLFQPFQRLHREDEFPGLGIGLATVQRIVHRHGGQIQATAAPNQGATFTITLPR